MCRNPVGRLVDVKACVVLSRDPGLVENVILLDDTWHFCLQNRQYNGYADFEFSRLLGPEDHASDQVSNELRRISLAVQFFSTSGHKWTRPDPDRASCSNT